MSPLCPKLVADILKGELIRYETTYRRFSSILQTLTTVCDPELDYQRASGGWDQEGEEEFSVCEVATGGLTQQWRKSE